MPIDISGIVGPQVQADGTTSRPRMGKSAEMVFQELHGRFYEQAYRGNLYHYGTSGLIALTANHIVLTASGTPILGVWNPITNINHLVILQIALTDALNNVTGAPPGLFVMAASVNNSAVTTGNAPINGRTLAAVGSSAKAFGGVTAMSGLTNTLTVISTLELGSASALLTTTVAAATPTPTITGVANIDGSIIVPPGGMFGVFNTVSTTTHSVGGRIVWEEVPV